MISFKTSLDKVKFVFKLLKYLIIWCQTFIPLVIHLLVLASFLHHIFIGKHFQGNIYSYSRIICIYHSGY